MMINETQAYELLLRSLDVSLDPAAQALLDEALAGSASLRRKREQLLAFREMAARQHYQFRPFFAARVMNRLAERGYGRIMGVPILPAAFRRVAIPALALILLLLMGVYLMDGSLSLDAVIGTYGLSLADIEENYWVNL